jgi:hypothetical protein
MKLDRFLTGSLLSGGLLLSSYGFAGEQIMVDKAEYEQLKAAVKLLMEESKTSKQAVQDAQQAASEAAASAQAASKEAERVAEQGRAAPKKVASTGGRISGNEFNPAISLILDGRYTDIDNSDLELPGFQLGGEAGLPDNGFTTGHNELVISANIDDKFYGALTAAIVYDEGETEFELEEAYIETLGLGHGLTLKGGRFFSGIGYLNSIHDHAHDFADRPLVYDALFGGHLMETGLQARWVAPTDFYLSFGAEVTSGSEFPGGENDNNNGLGFFVKTGGDINESSSWQLGASYYTTDFDVREAGGHSHGHGDDEADNELLDGDVDIAGIDFVYKWAPNGNPKQTNFKFQAEYFVRDEKGHAEFTEGLNSAEADYDGEQEGFYAQAIYQFMPAWRVGVRYDHLEADNRFINFVDNGIDLDEFLEESGLGTVDDPNRTSVMLDYTPSHFSRIRLQYSEFDNGLDDTEDMITLQYIMSLGSHGAHSY